MRLSIVSTLYNSSNSISEFYKRVSAVAHQFAGEEYEIILVNDGSPDDSFDKAIHFTKQDENLVLVDLSRNFGHHKAILTGLKYAKGDFVFLLDSDLEEEPEWLFAFYPLMKEKKCDVVFGVQKKRKGGWFECWSGWVFYRTFKLITGVKIPENWVTARLMTHRYVSALLQHQERELSIGGLYLLTGFDQYPKSIVKNSLSVSTYTLGKKIAVFVDAVTSLSSRPLIGVFYTGAFIFTFSLLYTFYILTNWMFLAVPPSGWTSLIVSVWLLSGLTISFLGIIGIYLSKIFLEAKHRPLSLVREIHKGQK
ncbi:MAG: glycosyltransferase [Candidatus Electrothrix sp. AX5]|nr:glycosyltransferase [Candidatus Electrothrix sp. AX5]